MVDLAIFIIVKLSSPDKAAGKESGSPAEPPVVDAAGDFLGHIVTTFMKHIRNHETLS